MGTLIQKKSTRGRLTPLTPLDSTGMHNTAAPFGTALDRQTAPLPSVLSAPSFSSSGKIPDNTPQVQVAQNQTDANTVFHAVTSRPKTHYTPGQNTSTALGSYVRAMGAGTAAAFAQVGGLAVSPMETPSADMERQQLKRSLAEREKMRPVR